MSHEHEVLDAFNGSSIARIRQALMSLENIDARVSDGVSSLFLAVMHGDSAVVELVLAMGADPNLRAMEPGDTIYADTALDLALQAQFLMSDDRFTSIIELLIANGARDFEGKVPDEADRKDRARRLRENGTLRP